MSDFALSVALFAILPIVVQRYCLHIPMIALNTASVINAFWFSLLVGCIERPVRLSLVRRRRNGAALASPQIRYVLNNQSNVREDREAIDVAFHSIVDE